MEQIYWIIIDNRPAGPFSIDELREHGVGPTSMAWREGMADWAPASTIADLVPLFAAERVCEATQPSETRQTWQRQSGEFSDEQQAPVAAAEVEPCPPTYLGWSIASTILCCTLLGIVAIIFSAQVKNSYARGDFEKARKQSEWAQWMIILAITLGVLSWPFQLALSSMI